MEPRRDDFNLAAELRGLRPAPRPSFAAELDARAAAGFPSRPGPGTSRLRRVATRLTGMPRQRVLAPAGALAVAAIAIATGVLVATEDGPAPERSSSMRQQEKSPRFFDANFDGGGRGAGVETEELKPFSRAVKPTLQDAASPNGKHLMGEGVTATSAANLSFEGNSRSSGPYASQANRREIERSAHLVLGTEPADVREATARVFETVHSYDGIVLRSSVRDGASGDAGATFDLLIPTAKLGDALAAFSGIAEVRSRHESTQDITAPTITVGEHLRDARAKVESLLSQLADADTDAERRAVEAQLRNERFRVAALRSRLATLQRRANFSHVSLRIETGADTSAGGDGDWGIGDALEDAGRILGVAAAVTLIALAVLAPLAILGLLAWLGAVAWRRRSRERALD